MKINGTQLTVKGRTGAEILIDDTDAANAKHVHGLIIGEPITSAGTLDRSGLLHATSISKAKHSIYAWPEDKF